MARRLRELKNPQGVKPFNNFDDILQIGVKYNFMSGIVSEVISNPAEFLSRDYDAQGVLLAKDQTPGTGKKFSVRQVLANRRNKKYADNLELLEYVPMNSIIAYITDDNIASDGGAPVICYPFFPPHLSFPAKPGEYVWIVREDIKGADIYYWMCRKVGIRQVDDINYTHLGRTNDVVDVVENFKLTQNIPNDESKKTLVSFQKIKQSNLPKHITYDQLVQSSAAYKEEFTGEPVPRIAKDCGDMLVQGSNNAFLHMTTEKFRPPESFQPELNTSFNEANPNRKPLSAAIDLCVGRKTWKLNIPTGEDSENTSDVTENTPKIENIRGPFHENLQHFEVNKNADIMQVDSATGAHDDDNTEILEEHQDFIATDCSARLYLTMNGNADTDFENITNKISENESELGRSFAALYADNVRLISEYTAVISSKNSNAWLSMEDGTVHLRVDGEEADDSLPGVIHIENHKRASRLMLEDDNNIRLTTESGIINIGEDDISKIDQPYVRYDDLVKVLDQLIANQVTIANAMFDLSAGFNTAILSCVPVSPSASVTRATALSNALLAVQTGVRFPTSTMKVGHETLKNTLIPAIASEKIFGQ